jgi:hypothetical protein
MPGKKCPREAETNRRPKNLRAGTADALSRDYATYAPRPPRTDAR